jgi:hypothetical protein
VGTDIQLGASGTTRDFSTTRTRNYSSKNTDYVDGSGYMQETYNFNIKNNGNTNTSKIKQRGSDTLQSLTDLTKRDVDGNWCAKSRLVKSVSDCNVSEPRCFILLVFVFPLFLILKL